jgi:hypothetical protein
LRGLGQYLPRRLSCASRNGALAFGVRYRVPQFQLLHSFIPNSISGTALQSDMYASVRDGWQCVESAWCKALNDRPCRAIARHRDFIA